METIPGLIDIQRRLKARGLYAADLDGLWGKGSRGGINAVLDMLDKLDPPAIPPHPKVPMELILGAMQAERTYGVPASVSLAQWALESGWGKSMPPGSNNPFGMKARKNETGPVVYVNTKEQRVDGSWYTIRAPFRKFKDMGEAFEEHAKLVGTAPIYAKARAKLPDRDAYIDAMGAIYATAKDYAKLLKQIIASNGFAVYDRLAT